MFPIKARVDTLILFPMTKVMAPNKQYAPSDGGQMALGNMKIIEFVRSRTARRLNVAVISHVIVRPLLLF